MKRLIALTLLLILALAACDAKPDPDPIPLLGGVDGGTPDGAVAAPTPDEQPPASKITLTTELEYYSGKMTARILAFWENNTDTRVLYGEKWDLERYDEEKQLWTPVGETRHFSQNDYLLEPGQRTKHIYDTVFYLDEIITEGRYRIKTEYSAPMVSVGTYMPLPVTAEFTVTSDESLLKVSELDYDDLSNSYELEIYPPDFPVRIYKHYETYDTTVVIGGEEYCKIAEGTGQWGVLWCNYIQTDDGGRHLIYPYSREEDGKKYAYIGVFDLDLREEIFRSNAVEDYDLLPFEYINGTLSVYAVRYSEHQSGFGASVRLRETQISRVLDRETGLPMVAGYLTYENGEYRFDPP